MCRLRYNQSSHPYHYGSYSFQISQKIYQFNYLSHPFFRNPKLLPQRHWMLYGWKKSQRSWTAYSVNNEISAPRYCNSACIYSGTPSNLPMSCHYPLPSSLNSSPLLVTRILTLLPHSTLIPLRWHLFGFRAMREFSGRRSGRCRRAIANLHVSIITHYLPNPNSHFLLVNTSTIQQSSPLVPPGHHHNNSHIGMKFISPDSSLVALPSYTRTSYHLPLNGHHSLPIRSSSHRRPHVFAPHSHRTPKQP